MSPNQPRGPRIGLLFVGALALFLAQCAPASAGPITSYPAATTPLTGAETVIGNQGASTVQITASSIAAQPVATSQLTGTLPAARIGSTTVTGQSAASSLSGSESFLASQSGAPVKVTASQLATYAETALPEYIVGPGLYGFACDDTTDDTAALNALDTTVNTAGGGTIEFTAGCLISGQITLPNSGGGSLTQHPIRWTGVGFSANGTWSTPPTTKSFLDLRYNAATAKIITQGAGLFEIDHLALVDGGSDCAPFIYTTNTTLNVHNALFSGTASGLSACNKVAILGGTSTTIGNTLNAPFQGYGTVFSQNFFDKMSELTLQSYTNGVVIRDNTWSLTSGSNTNIAIASATNANPAVLTVTAGHNFATGQVVSLDFTGYTGSWTSLNGVHFATALSSTTLSVPIDSTSFGALTGTPTYYSGCALNFDGATGGTQGNEVSGNLIETTFYACFARLNNATQTNFTDNGIWDRGSAFTANYLTFNTTASSEGVVQDTYGTSCQIGVGGCTIPEFAGAGASQWYSTSLVINNGFWGNQTVYLGSLRMNEVAGGATLSNTNSLIFKEGASQSANPIQVQNSSGTQIFSVGTGGLVTATGLSVPSGYTLQFSGVSYIDSTTAEQFYRPGGTNKLDYGATNASAWTFAAPVYFPASGIHLLGSSTGNTTFTSANAGASNYTITVPAITDTLGTLTATQTLTNKTLAGPVFSTFVHFTPTTVSGLATADPSPSDGDKAYVTDATACTFNTAVTGSGSTHCPVHYDGSSSSWKGG